jgi:ankyrin repeat protein
MKKNNTSTLLLKQLRRIFPNEEKCWKALAADFSSATVADSRGATPMMLAAKEGMGRLALTLNDFGASVKETDAKRRSVLHYALMPTIPDAAFVARLCQEGADIHAQDKSGKSPLQLACAFHSAALARKMLAASAEYAAAHTSPEQKQATALNKALNSKANDMARP